MKTISVMTPCYNEEQNIAEVYQRVKAIFKDLPQYQYEHLFIDNASTDKTAIILKELAYGDKNVKVIVNARNFGHIRSPYHALLQTVGDAVISIAADLQEPPELIKDFVKKWEEGYKIVIGVRLKSYGNWLMSLIRKMYYILVTKIADAPLIRDCSGFGLYDRSFIETIRKLDDPYPYFRGLIAELGSSIAEIPYVQPKRKYGKTKNNFYTLFDMAMLGVTCHSKMPLRIMTISGFLLSVTSLLISVFFLVYKLIFWESFTFGMAPILIGLFFFSSVQLFFIGMIGEYVAAIHTQVLKRPLVIEKERINF